MNSEEYTPFSVAGNVTKRLRPKLSFTTTGLPISWVMLLFMELIVRLTLIIQLFLPDFAQIMRDKDYAGSMRVMRSQDYAKKLYIIKTAEKNGGET